MTRYVALLRGINVGGNNIIKMPDLITLFESLGYTNISTYIQSGNVLFSAEESDALQLTARLEEALSIAFNYQSTLLLRSDKEMRAIIEQAPEGFGSDPDTYRYDVLFLKHPLTAPDALGQLKSREGVDQAWAGSGVLYFCRLISRASQSYLTKVNTMPIYQSITVRNWNTTTKLFQLMKESAAAGGASEEVSA